MYTVKRTDAFNTWLHGLKDGMTRRRLLLRLRKASLGSLGDVKPVGSGVFEMREHFGPGWRMYYVQRRKTVVILLCGGGKANQTADIARALKLAAAIED